jgi:hypothetical protein
MPSFLGFARLISIFLLCLGAAQAAPRGGKKPPPKSRDGSLLVQSTTLGAIIVVDGQPMGEVPMEAPLPLKPGDHSIKLTKAGHADYIDTFRIEARKRTLLEIDLLPVAGILRFDSTPTGAAVVVDGRQLGETPYEGELKPGPRVVELRLPGYTVYQREIIVNAGELYPLAADLVPLAEVPVDTETPWYGHWWVWAGTAVVVGGLTAALLLGGEEDLPPDPPFLLEIEPIR